MGGKFSQVIKGSETLENIVIHEITEVKERDFGIGGTAFGGMHHVERVISIDMPQNMLDKYLKKTAYARYDVSIDYELFDYESPIIFLGYKLCSELISGKDFPMPDKVRKVIAEQLSEQFEMVVSDMQFFTAVDDAVYDNYRGDEDDIYLKAAVKINEKNGIFISRIVGIWDSVGLYDLDDMSFSEPIEDETKMCIVFCVDKVTVNGVSYALNID